MYYKLHALEAATKACPACTYKQLLYVVTKGYLTTKGYLKATKGCGTPRKRPSKNTGHRYRRANMNMGQTTLEQAKSVDEPNFIVSYQS